MKKDTTSPLVAGVSCLLFCQTVITLTSYIFLIGVLGVTPRASEIGANTRCPVAVDVSSTAAENLCQGRSVGGNCRGTLARINQKLDVRKSKRTCTNKDIRREYIEAHVLDTLARYVFDESLIPTLIQSYNDYQDGKNVVNVKKKQAAQKRLHEIENQISNLIKLAAESYSPTLVERLNQLEDEKKVIEEECAAQSKEEKQNFITEEELTKCFSEARKLMLAKRLETTKKLISLFIEKVIVYHDRVDVSVRFRPGIVNGELIKGADEVLDREEMELFASCEYANEPATGMIGGGENFPLTSTNKKEKNGISPRCSFVQARRRQKRTANSSPNSISSAQPPSTIHCSGP